MDLQEHLIRFRQTRQAEADGAVPKERPGSQHLAGYA
jgi:hypothetical protein